MAQFDDACHLHARIFPGYDYSGAMSACCLSAAARNGGCAWRVNSRMKISQKAMNNAATKGPMIKPFMPEQAQTAQRWEQHE